VGGWALQQLWLFIVALLIAAVIAAFVYRGIAVPMLTTREAGRALPTEQDERLKSRATAPQACGPNPWAAQD
jgi:aquaporin Z